MSNAQCCRALFRGRTMIDLLQNTFVTMFDGSPEKALRAVLIVMGVYVLTAAPLVTWVVYGLFQKDPNVSTAVCIPEFAVNYLP
jgi:Na+/proline symporter